MLQGTEITPNPWGTRKCRGARATLDPRGGGRGSAPPARQASQLEAGENPPVTRATPGRRLSRALLALGALLVIGTTVFVAHRQCSVGADRAEQSATGGDDPRALRERARRQDLGGLALAEQGRLEGAIERFREALRLDPTLAAARGHLAIALFHRGQSEAALATLDRALLADPQAAELFEVRSRLRGRLGDEPGALTDLRAALRLAPDRLDLAQALAWSLATHPDPVLRDPDTALSLAQQVARAMRQERADVYDTLAVAYAAAGRFEQALESADWALRSLHPSDPTQLEPAIRAHRAAFEAQRPWREAPDAPRLPGP